MTRSDFLPVYPDELVPLSAAQQIFFTAVVAAHRAVGAWKRNDARSGDLATMTWRDMAYWLCKARRPITLPEAGARLEGLLSPATMDLPLPAGFAPDRTVTLAAVGDLMGHAFLAESRGALYGAIADLLFDADLRLANLEAVLAPERGAAGVRGDGVVRPPILDFDPEALDVLTAHDGAAFSLVSLANNHVLDHGVRAAVRTRRWLEQRGIAQHGLNARRAEAARPAVIEAKGLRVAVVSFTFGLNAHRPPADAPWLVNHLPLNDAGFTADAALLRDQLATARSEADLTVASLHWGMEFEYVPRPEQQRNARELAELGADLIVGHHPHVVQPMELYRTARDHERVVPIFYSLGNLTTPCSAPFVCESLLARVEVTRGRTAAGDERTYVTRVEPRRIRQRADPSRRQVRLEPLSREEEACR